MDKKKELYFDEKTWERYVASHPEVFLGESLRLRSQQETAQSGRFDLTFWDEENRIVLVELQLQALDRTHWFKVLEYNQDLLEEGYLDVRIIILCNEIDPRRDYVNVYKDNLSLDINVITMAENEAKLAIQQIDPSIIFSKAPLQKKKQDKNGNNQVEVPISEYIDLHRKASETDRAVKKLEERTDASLNLVMQNLPYDIRIMVRSSYQDDKKYRNLDDWEDHFVSLVCGHAKVIKKFGDYGWEEAFCPLCGGGKQEFYGDGSRMGFRFPVGLERHLLGSYGARQCKVVKIFMFKIRDYFQELEKRKREENTEKILLEYNSRREKEQLYRLHPFKHVHLIDEEFSYQGPRFISTGYKFNSWNKESPRLADDWCFAVDRLDQLKFAVSEFDQEIEYKWSHKNIHIFADPRLAGRLVLRAYDISKVKSVVQVKSYDRYHLGTLEIKDAFFKTNEKLFRKFQNWLKAINK